MVASIIGHRKMPEDENLINKIEAILKYVIQERHVNVFYSGAKVNSTVSVLKLLVVLKVSLKR